MSRWPRMALRHLLLQAGRRIDLKADETYTQVTVKLWGKGLTPRGRVKGAEIAADQQVCIASGQFLISKIDARHGAFGVVPPDLDGAVVSNDFPVFDVNQALALTEYISWISRTDWFVALCRRASEGSTNRVRLKEAVFLAQEIPLPSLEEQGLIVDRLGAAAKLVAAHRRAVEAVDAEIAATLTSAFRGIVDGAPRARMGDIAPLVRRPVVVEPDETYPELGVRSFGRGLFSKPDLLGSDLTWQSLFRIEAGDLVFSNIKAWEGAFAVAEVVSLVVV